jgi:hypothetical protein
MPSTRNASLGGTLLFLTNSRAKPMSCTPPWVAPKPPEPTLGEPKLPRSVQAIRLEVAIMAIKAVVNFMVASVPDDDMIGKKRFECMKSGQSNRSLHGSKGLRYAALISKSCSMRC